MADGVVWGIGGNFLSLHEVRLLLRLPAVWFGAKGL